MESIAALLLLTQVHPRPAIQTKDLRELRRVRSRVSRLAHQVELTNSSKRRRHTLCALAWVSSKSIEVPAGVRTALQDGGATAL